MDSTYITDLNSGYPMYGAVTGDTFNTSENCTITKFWYGNSRYNHDSSYGGGLQVVKPPLLAVENIERPCRPVTCAPVKVEEKVVVVDGIMYKKELWRERGECGNWRYSVKCKLAHGKEELHPNRALVKNKAEENIWKPPTTALSCFGPKSSFIDPGMLAEKGADATNQTAPFATPAQSSKINTILKSIPSRNWSPCLDGIEIALPSSLHKIPPREDVDIYIHDVLYGATSKRRLQAFTENYSQQD